MEQEEKLEHIKKEGNITDERAEKLEEKIEEKQFNPIKESGKQITKEATQLDSTAETIYMLTYGKQKAKYLPQEETKGQYDTYEAKRTEDYKDGIVETQEFTKWLNNTPEEEWRPLLLEFNKH